MRDLHRSEQHHDLNQNQNQTRHCSIIAILIRAMIRNSSSQIDAHNDRRETHSSAAAPQQRHPIPRAWFTHATGLIRESPDHDLGRDTRPLFVLQRPLAASGVQLHATLTQLDPQSNQLRWLLFWDDHQGLGPSGLTVRRAGTLALVAAATHVPCGLDSVIWMSPTPCSAGPESRL